jgi:hypothetical protein
LRRPTPIAAGRWCSAEEFRAELEEARAWGTPQNARAIAEALSPSSSEEDRAALATLLRQSASPGAVAALARMNRESDIRAILGTIRVPTVVMNRTGDHPYIVAGSKYLAERIPHARHVEFPGADHSISAGNTPAVLAEIEQFLRASWEAHVHEESKPERVLATVLFTDIVGSTAKAAELREGSRDRRPRGAPHRRVRGHRRQGRRHRGAHRRARREPGGTGRSARLVDHEGSRRGSRDRVQ